MPNPQPIGTPTARNPYQTWCLNAHSGIAMKPTTSIQTAMVSCSAIPIILAVKHSFSPNPFPSSSDLPIWMHLMLRLARSIWMLEKYAKKKERQKIERKKWKKPWKEDVGSTASLHNENVQETHSQSFFFFFFSSETQYTHKYFQTNSLDWDPPNWATTHEQHKSMKMLVTLVGENFERM